MCQCMHTYTHTHTPHSSQLVLFQSLLIPLVGSPCPDSTSTCQGCCLVRPRPSDMQQGLLWSLWQVQRAWRKQQSRHFRSRTRLGCCQKFMFALIVAHIGKHSKHPCKLLSCTECPRMSIITMKSEWNIMFCWNRSQVSRAVSPYNCRQIWCIHTSQERTPLKALMHGRTWRH